MRLKIIAGNLAVVLVLGVGAYLAVGGQLRAALLGRIDARIASDRELLERSFRLSAREFIDLVAERAAERAMRDVFAGLDLASRRTRAYEAAEATHAWFADPARGQRGGPDIVVVVDEAGTAIARNGARNVMFGTALLPELPALAGALERGRATHDVWLEDHTKKVFQTAMAPIRAEAGGILGALVVGYDLSNGLAKRESDLLGREIAFLIEGKVYSSSLPTGPARALAEDLFGRQGATTSAVLGGTRSTSEPWTIVLEGAEYLGLTARLPMAPSMPVAFAVLGNRSAEASLADVVDVILILMVVCVILVGLYGFVIGNALSRPIEEIEEGVLAVINGRTDLRLETDSAELGGLAFRINQLLNVFTGTAEATEDESGSKSLSPSEATWTDAAFGDAQPGGGAPAAGQTPGPDEPIEDAALAARLGGESESAYAERVYREYVAAKRAVGEDVGSITQDRFAQRLVGRADALAKKHQCRLVRFHVQTHGGQVLLRPVLIR